MEKKGGYDSAYGTVSNISEIHVFSRWIWQQKANNDELLFKWQSLSNQIKFKKN